MREFRKLRADEIMIRPTDTKYKGSALLLAYKDARCDMNILDDTVGQMNWCKRYYEVKGNLYCSVGIKDDNGEWVYKDDCGIESNTDAEKGEASDAFKRACFNWGIGRELYTTPKIRIKCPDSYYYNDKMNMTFTVSEIEYMGNMVSKIVIVDRFGNVVFNWAKGQQVQQEVQQMNYTTTEQKDNNALIPKGLWFKVTNTQSIENLKDIWNDNPQYHENVNFKRLVNNKKAALAAAS